MQSVWASNLVGSFEGWKLSSHQTNFKHLTREDLTQCCYVSLRLRAGVRGTVTDENGRPLLASITLEGAEGSPPCWTSNTTGQYFRWAGLVVCGAAVLRQVPHGKNAGGQGCEVVSACFVESTRWFQSRLSCTAGGVLVSVRSNESQRARCCLT